MANNVTANPGVGGATFTALDLSSFVSYPTTGELPACCIYVGASTGSAPTPLSSSNPLYSQLTAGSAVIGHVIVDSGAVTVSGVATAANQATEVASLASIDGKITAVNTGAVVIASGTLTTVSTVTNLSQMGGVAIALNTGTRSAGTQRVTIATDDVVPASQSGTWTVGLSAAQTLATVTTVGTVTTITNVVHVDDNSGSLTVDYATTGSGNATGALRVELANNGTGTLSTLTTLTTCSTVTTLTGSPIAHDGADSGNPHKIGAKAITSLATTTLVSSADRTDAQSDLDGCILVRDQFPLGDLKSDATSNTDGASTASAVFTAVASTKNYITAFQIFRTDAGTTPIYIDFRDGTGGSVIWRAVLPPNGGSNSPSANVPLFKTSAATALAYDVSAATSTVYINVSGFQSKVS